MRWDVGGRFIWKVTRPLHVSVEALRRYDTSSAVADGIDSNRFVGCWNTASARI
jgi:hypothetical protein